MSGPFFIALRRLRAPLITVILLHAVSMLGLVLIPGETEHGEPWHMGFFHALYFMSYTATTTGFGELPRTFSDAQRMWVMVSIYALVIGWTYAIGSMFALLQDPNFKAIRVRQRFQRGVRHLREPFFIICGFGETGQLLGRFFERANMRYVVVDIDPARVDELLLMDHLSDVPGLAGDARNPENLIAAGLTHRDCRGVVTLTNDDGANLAVAISARLLNDKVPALCRAERREVADNMRSFDTAFVINPFDTFADYLALSIRAPAAYQLARWLTALPGSEVPRTHRPPKGHWVMCGYGRFGRAVVEAAREEGLEITIVDPHDPWDVGLPWVRGLGTEAPTLQEAGIRRAVGIVAGTEDDVNNLSIVVTARDLNPDVYVVIRQNLQTNAPLFKAFPSDSMMVPSQIIAQECLANLTTPLLPAFLHRIKTRGNAWSLKVIEHLESVVGEQVPEVWGLRVGHADAPAVTELVRNGNPLVLLDHLLRDPADAGERLPALVLFRIRGHELVDLPDDQSPLQLGDELLFAGSPGARERQALSLHNRNVLDYVRTGCDVPGGAVWRWWAQRRRGVEPDSDGADPSASGSAQ